MIVKDVICGYAVHTFLLELDCVKVRRFDFPSANPVPTHNRSWNRSYTVLGFTTGVANESCNSSWWVRDKDQRRVSHAPKPMIEIGGMPLLWHIMKIYSHHGINDFIICCGYKGFMIKNISLITCFICPMLP